MKKNLLKELLNYKIHAYEELDEEKMLELYHRLVYKLSIINTFYMTIINFDDIIGNKFKTITNNVFCLNHPSNCLFIGKTNSGKTNIVMNLIAKNSIYEKNLYL